jgi:hypothetical protein
MYYVVFEYGPKAGAYNTIRTTVAYKDEADWKQSACCGRCAADPEYQKVVEEGLSFSEAQEMAARVAPFTILAAQLSKLAGSSEPADPALEDMEDEMPRTVTVHPYAVMDTFPSKSRPDKPPHEVRISKQDGRVYCTCKSWQMRKTCRHLKSFLESLDGGLLDNNVFVNVDTSYVACKCVDFTLEGKCEHVKAFLDSLPGAET